MTNGEMLDVGRIRLSGNQSVVRGAIEAGVRVATGYPGAPISDLQMSFEQLANNIPQANAFTINVGEMLDQIGYQLKSLTSILEVTIMEKPLKMCMPYS